MIDRFDCGGEVCFCGIFSPGGIKSVSLAAKGVKFALYCFFRHGRLLPCVNAVFHQQFGLFHIAVKLDDFICHVTPTPG